MQRSAPLFSSYLAISNHEHGRRNRRHDTLVSSKTGNTLAARSGYREARGWYGFAAKPVHQLKPAAKREGGTVSLQNLFIPAPFKHRLWDGGYGRLKAATYTYVQPKACSRVQCRRHSHSDRNNVRWAQLLFHHSLPRQQTMSRCGMFCQYAWRNSV